MKFRVAPADEYFGKLKMRHSRHSEHDQRLGLKADSDPAHAEASVMGGIPLTEDAMHDWEKKYPADTWIPPAILSLERLYAKIDTDSARAKAKITMLWLVHDNPASAPAKVGKKELAANAVGVKPAATPAPATVAGAPNADGTLPVPEK